jgi:multicomponent Na+:H+ antiporter subunit D
MNQTLILPIIIPLLTAIISIFLKKSMIAQRIIGFIGSTVNLITVILIFHTVRVEGMLVLQMGEWPAPFGITLVADLFSSIMLILAALTGLSVFVYAISNIDLEKQLKGFYPLYQFLLMGICGAFLTGDIFNLYVWFEVMLIASFVLLILGGERPQMEGAVKYVTINLFSSVLFLIGAGILYGKTGSLNMADLSFKLSQEPDSILISSTSVLFLLAFGIKAALFPLFFWLPASYHTPPAAISAIFAGLLTKVGVYAIIRTFSLVFIQRGEIFLNWLLIFSALTMISGVLGAASQNNIRKILSFHIISQIGYMIMGFAFFTPLALAGAIFYIIHHIIVKTNLFLISGVIHFRFKTENLASIGGLYKKYPLFALLFMIPAFSLAGIPPFSGFFAKFTLIMAGLEIKQYYMIAIAMLVGILTLFSMMKIWAEAFWKTDPASIHNPGVINEKQFPVFQMIPIIFLAALTVLIGLMAEPLFQVASQAANQVLNPSEYIFKVIGVR